MTSTSDLAQASVDVMEGALGYAGSPIVLEVVPVPASRPRVTRWGTYYTKTYQTFRTQAEALVQELPEAEPYEGPIVVVVEIVLPRPAKPSNTYPKRGDVDNFIKGPLDALTKSGKVWKDDSQIIGMSGFKRYAKGAEKPHVRVNWFPLEAKDLT